jgi:hypothetical protein
MRYTGVPGSVDECQELREALFPASSWNVPRPAGQFAEQADPVGAQPTLFVRASLLPDPHTELTAVLDDVLPDEGVAFRCRNPRSTV